MKIMQIAVWHPDYETGNLLIDEQHKTLFKIVNDLADATARNARREVLRQILNELINEVDIHFKDEEELVKPLGYGGYFSHKANHSYLQEVLLEASTKFDRDSSFLTLETIRSLLDLIVRHICEEDMPMMQYVSKCENSDSTAFAEAVPPMTISQLFEF
jgi:hemerythrin